jgi:DNA-binding MarR family transcriptional regulator
VTLIASSWSVVGQNPAVNEFLDGYLPYLLQRADQLLSARFHQRLAEEGVSTSEWRVLAVLREFGPLSVGLLTRSTLLPQPTTTHAVSRLEQDGLVRRRSDGRDGRIRIVALTPSGKRRAAQLTKVAEAESRATLSAAGIDSHEQLVTDLRRLCGALDDGRISIHVN